MTPSPLLAEHTSHTHLRRLVCAAVGVMAVGVTMQTSEFATADDSRVYQEPAGRTFLRRVTAEKEKHVGASVPTRSSRRSANTGPRRTKTGTVSQVRPGRSGNFTVITDRRRKPATRQRTPDSAAPVSDAGKLPGQPHSRLNAILRPAPAAQSPIRHVAGKPVSNAVKSAIHTVSPTTLPYPPEETTATAQLQPEPDPLFSPMLFGLRRTPVAAATASVAATVKTTRPVQSPAATQAYHEKELPRQHAHTERIQVVSPGSRNVPLKPAPALAATRSSNVPLKPASTRVGSGRSNAKWSRRSARPRKLTTEVELVVSGTKARLRRVPTNAELREWQLPVLVPVSHSTISPASQEPSLDEMPSAQNINRLPSDTPPSDAQSKGVDDSFDFEETTPPRRKRRPAAIDEEFGLDNPARDAGKKTTDDESAGDSTAGDANRKSESLDELFGVDPDTPPATEADRDGANKRDTGNEDDRDDDENDTNTDIKEDDSDSKSISRLFGSMQSIDVVSAVHVPIDADSEFTEPKNRAGEIVGARTPGMRQQPVHRIYSGQADFRHQPLYFSENDLEMCGQTAGCLTTVRSTVRFFGNMIALPVRCCAVAPWRAVSGDLRCSNDTRPVINALAEDPRDSVVPIDHPAAH